MTSAGLTGGSQGPGSASDCFAVVRIVNILFGVSPAAQTAGPGALNAKAKNAATPRKTKAAR